ncbi:leucine-rich repeat-containing protein [Tanacetum coccineum]
MTQRPSTHVGTTSIIDDLTQTGHLPPMSPAHSASFTEYGYVTPSLPPPSPPYMSFSPRERLSGLSSSHLGDGITHPKGPVDHPISSNSSRAGFSPRREKKIGIQVHLSLTRLNNNYFGIYLEEALNRAGLRCCTGTPPRKTRASVIVLTEGYATSSPSLPESLEERRNSNHFVLPVFYHIEPSYIIEHGKKLMLESSRGSQTSLKKVDQWHAALTEVANIPGISFSRWSRNDDDMAGIREIVSIVKHALYPSPVGSPSHPTETTSRAD